MSSSEKGGKALRVAVSLGLAAVLLVLFLRTLDFAAVGKAIRGAHVGWLAAATACGLMRRPLPFVALGAPPQEGRAPLGVRPQLGDVDRLRGVDAAPRPRRRDRPPGRPRAPRRAARRALPRVDRARAAHRPRDVRVPLRRLRGRLGAAEHGRRGGGPLRDPPPVRAPLRRGHALRPRCPRPARREARAHGPLRQAVPPPAAREDRRAHRGDPAVFPGRSRRPRHREGRRASSRPRRSRSGCSSPPRSG